MASCAHIRHTCVVKSAATLPERTNDVRTRDRVTRLLLERGPLTAAHLAALLGMSPAGVRRHLDSLMAQGRVDERVGAVNANRGRGRPARRYALSEQGRAGFPHAYDDLALAALRHIAASEGAEAVARFTAERVTGLEERCRDAMDSAASDSPEHPLARAEALAEALTREGYAASASAIAAGGQLCQHHCPVAHVAAEFPQLCEAETQVISRLVGTHVQRLATIAHGDGVCTTYIPPAPPSRIPSRRTPR
ncbi:MAG: ArsR family transcriptional regulator [Geodermatophilaceae bacterium]|nr:ArsR family transcriptional regulator [Geodermatophilaceae bacterium]